MEEDTKIEEVRSIVNGLVNDAVKAGFADYEKRTAPRIELATNERAESYRSIKSAMMEKRAITIGGSGKYNVVPELAKILLKKTPLLSAVRLFNGRDAISNIPTFAVAPSTSVAVAESGSLTSDSASALAVKSLTPKQYGKILTCSWESLNLSAVDFESELPELYTRAFAVDLQDQIVNGDGTGNNMTGLFLNTAITNDITFTAAAAPKLSDILALALKVVDFMDGGAIVMSPSCYAALMGDTTAEMQFLKNEMAINKSVEGVKIILTSAAPYATTSGSVVAVAGDMQSYGLGIAGEMVIKPVESSSTMDTLFKAAIWAAGAPIVPANFWQLRAA